MMFGNLLGQRTLELRLFPPQNTEGKRRQRFGIALPRQQGDEPPAPAAAQQIRDDAGELDIGILQDFDDPVVRPGAALDQGPRVHVRSARIRLVGLLPRAPPHLLGMAHEHLRRAYQHVVDRAPIDPGALQRDDRALLIAQPPSSGNVDGANGRF
jgi:hypothetical protein